MMLENKESGNDTVPGRKQGTGKRTRYPAKQTGGKHHGKDDGAGKTELEI
ncbi:MAG: hypothetical protein IJR00_08465 [Lachnospiraceae bacterium]|nr:hypothetical protein [Lachnospiraceae bacterium]